MIEKLSLSAFATIRPISTINRESVPVQERDSRTSGPRRSNQAAFAMASLLRESIGELKGVIYMIDSNDRRHIGPAGAAVSLRRGEVDQCTVPHLCQQANLGCNDCRRDHHFGQAAEGSKVARSGLVCDIWRGAVRGAGVAEPAIIRLMTFKAARKSAL